MKKIAPMIFQIKKRFQCTNIVIFLGLFLISFYSKSQDAVVNLDWTTLESDSLHFKQAYRSLKNHNLPWYGKSIKLNAPGEQIEWIPLKTDTITAPELTQEQKEFLPYHFITEKKLGYKQKDPLKNLNILPIKRSDDNDELIILTAFKYKVKELNEKTGRRYKKTGGKDWKDRSVLAQNDWYKIPVEQTGVHKITYDYLEDIGLNPDEIDPQDIHIFGNGGQMLPLTNGDKAPDDLKENAIWVTADNGTFNENDYILFYAKGPHQWKFQEDKEQFRHQKNDYADKGYYFLSVHNREASKRIEKVPSLEEPDYSTNEYTALYFHEKEVITEINRNINTGRNWFGEKFERNNVRNFNFSLDNEASSLYIEARVAHRASNGSRFEVKVNGRNQFDIGLNGVRINDYESSYCAVGKGSKELSVNGSNIGVTLDYKRFGNSVGWLDYIELQARSRLAFQNEQFPFRDPKGLDHEKVQYEIIEKGNNLRVWDVSNPYDVHEESLESGNEHSYFIDQGNDQLHQYVAFNAINTYEPGEGEQIANQNLHGLAQPDMLIITHPSIQEQAERLADYHREKDAMKVHVQTPGPIYNEFSSGNQDVAAIRNFTKMFYDRAENKAEQPDHLLLFGDASYDFKDRFQDNTNMVPTYQSLNSYSPQSSYSTDDFYGYLDSNEGDLSKADFSSSFLLDINIGRIPARNSEEAKAVVDKIYRYHDDEATFGDWQNVITFLADDMNESWEDRHLKDSEKLANIINNNYPAFNISKIYMDAYPQVTRSSGARYPEANKVFNKRIDKGSLIVNYIGHGGERGLAHEKILVEDDINQWSNANKLPLFITATCEFSRFDDPEFQSAGEKTLLKPDGGTIALLSTTRIVFASQNFNLNRSVFNNNLFEKVDGEHKTLGAIMTTAKNRIDQNSFVTNNRKFALLGDPALKLAYPRKEAVTTSINSQPYEESDSIKALQRVTMEGEIRNQGGSRIKDFNGIIKPTIYDKKIDQITLANDDNAEKIPFKVRNSIIYKGKASVNNGKFQFDFIVPKDISYEEGEGKISYYATNNQTDAHGHSFIQVGGTAENPVQDDQPPEVNLYLNHTDFESGNIVSQNPTLLAHVFDDHGINTAANGIGHQPTMKLDGGKPEILQDAYEANLDDSKSGKITNQLFDLRKGRHTLTLKVWDIANNSGKGTVEFVVAESTTMAIENLLNYPNPFSESTNFRFNHNQSGNPLNIEIRIFDIDGNHVKTLSQEVIPEGNQYSGIEWQGNNQQGNSLGSGMYVYQIRLQNANNEVVTQTDKLVIQK